MISAQEQERFNAYWQSLHQDGTLMFAGKLLERAAKQWPKRIAYICGDESITYRELFRRACLVSNQLRALGVGSEEKVLIWYENSIEFFIAYYGVWHTGAVVAALNVFLHPREFEHIITDARPKVVIISDQLLAKLDDAIKNNLPLRIDQAYIENTRELPGPSRCDIAKKDPDALAVLLYTSGTTGMPKGVMLSSRNLLMNVVQAISLLKLSPQDRCYVPVPLFHSLAQNAAVWSTIFMGASCVVVPKIDRRALLDGLKHNPTVILAVPSLYAIFCLMKTAPFKNVRYFISGGDALPDKIRAAFALIYGRKICNGYGMTETSPLIAAHVIDERVSADTVGDPVLGMQCSLRKDDQEVAQGEVGVLWVKGDNVMLGYYNAQEATHAILKDGWLNTGDLAQFDSAGRLHIVGREKDLISNKGFKIYPQEIENVLLSHPSVLMAAVIGVKDGGSDEIPVAYVTLKHVLKDAQAELHALCAQQLATYKIPRMFIVKSALPITAMGKIDKKQLRAEHDKKD
ncbi:MAG: class I adenylate-forming enzyme family protein [Candidatus Babeliales bacterium]